MAMKDEDYLKALRIRGQCFRRPRLSYRMEPQSFKAEELRDAARIETGDWTKTV
jgi:hypothetical protein